MSTRIIPIPWTTLIMDSLGSKDFPLTPYMASTSLHQARMTLEVIEVTGDAEVQAIRQRTDVENAAGVTLTFGPTLDTAGVHYPDGMSAMTDWQKSQLGRLGVRFTNNQSGLSVLRIGGSFETSDQD